MARNKRKTNTALISCTAADIVPQAIVKADIQADTALSIELLAPPEPVITAEANGSSAVLITEDTKLTGEYISENNDENALRIDGVSAALSDSVIKKTGGECTRPDAAAFGMNAALLAQNAATLAVTNTDMHTDASYSPAAFAYCTNTVLTVSDSTINTSGSDSAALYSTGAASLNAVQTDIATEGSSSPAIHCACDSSAAAEGGSFITEGADSPAILTYGSCTASDAAFSANRSEALRLFDGSKTSFTNCTLYGSMQDDENHSANVRIVSAGGREIPLTSFIMTGGMLRSDSGDMFYAENSVCDILLTDVLVAISNDVLLRLTGSDCTFTGVSQHLMGNFILDSTSKLTISMTDGGIYGGTVNPDNSGGRVDFILGDDCTWMLSGDAYLSSFTGNTGCIVSNGYMVYTDGTPLLPEPEK